ncbi:MAG: type I restriction enzyme HsdR N-terminal domain-containing protein [Ruminococcus sp.]|nr:type I restriction enzyme HsdR N-terminal domain-containing protein [Ruminococcus sp.]
MDFIDQIKQFSKRVDSLKDSLSTEEATKTSIIMPFFALLGYDVFNPEEFTPEFTADVGIKKGEKVDYAILNNGEPTILIECKWIGEPLDKHGSQLFRYFGTTNAKFGILTNGQIYRFFTDLEESNKMDVKPFLEIDILNVKDSQVAELKKFHKQNFNVETIFDSASELKYSNEFRNLFASQLQNPTDDFVRLFLANTYDGKCTQKVVDKFKPVIKKTINNYITELMNDKIKNALGSQDDNSKGDINEGELAEQEELTAEQEHEKKIITTEEELEAYFIVKNLLKSYVDINNITYKDNERYMAILLNGKTTKWICRFYFNTANKYIAIPDENKKEERITISNIYEIEKFQDKLAESLKKYLNK